MVTINEVARHAGVSTATVSHVINRNRYVSEPLTQRVEASIAALQYSPSGVAQSLRRGRTSVLGIITDNISNRFAGQFLAGLEAEASQRGYRILISDLHDDPEEEHRSLDLLLTQQVEGIVSLGFGAAEARLLELHRTGLPVVVADKPPSRNELPSVLIDNRNSVFMALRHLMAMGHQHIRYLNGSRFNRNSTIRARAFKDFMIRHRLPFSEDAITYNDYTLEAGYRSLREALARGREFTAVFCGDDLMAFGVMAALKERGLSIPGDVAVVGFCDDPLSLVMVPPLTTIRYPIREMGKAAFQLFTQLRDEKPVRNYHVELETELVIRHSSDPSQSKTVDQTNFDI